MYKTLTKDDLANHIGLSGQRINSLIVYGGYNPPKSQVEWCNKATFKLTDFMYPLFIDDGVVVTNAYGDAMMSEIVHIFASLGAKKATLIGTFGALQPRVDFGQVFLPSSAMAEDGASRIYSSKTEFYPDNELLARAEAIWQDTTRQTGKIVSISAMLGETWGMISEWRDKGYVGVDLETASFLAVANHFGLPAVAMHTLADNLVEQKTILDVDDNQHEQKRAIKNMLFERALRLVKE